MNDDLISRQAAIDALNAYEDVVDTASQVFTIRGCKKAITNLQPAQPEIIRCKYCMHNGSYDTDCPIDWNGKEYCSFAERITDECRFT